MVKLEAKIRSLPKNAVLACIAVYRKGISPLTPPSCRFIPTCSEYAQEAVLRYGVRKGGWMSIKRISKCHPWHAGGFDPVQ